MFSLVLELVQRLSILTLHFSYPTLCRSCSLQYNTERNKRESGGGRLAEEAMLGLQRGFWVCLSCALCGEWRAQPQFVL